MGQGQSPKLSRAGLTFLHDGHARFKHEIGQIPSFLSFHSSLTFLLCHKGKVCLLLIWRSVGKKEVLVL